MQGIADIFNEQRKYFKKGLTRDVDFRVLQLHMLRNALIDYEDELVDAMAMDLNRPEMESYISGIGLVLQEIDYMTKHLSSWVKPNKVHTDKVHFPAESRYMYEPKGVCLIMAPWNYPVHLLLMPLVGAIAAGNCCIIRPSEQTGHVAQLMEFILNNLFKQEYVHILRGDHTVSQQLMELPFDHIFFTGSLAGGKKVLRAAAENLTPVTLELGGKNPCIVDSTAKVELAAKRIVWGKFQNAGQICLSPDYVLVHASQKDALITHMSTWMQKFFGKAVESRSYGYVISPKHVMRLAGYLENANILYGGRYEREARFFEPTLIDGVDFGHPVMKEEIFGPILPILTYENFKDIIPMLQDMPSPLALYLFSENKKHQELIIGSIPFGGGCLNDTLSHMSNPHLPFGGVGMSGMGKYHGWFSFETFSHTKSWLVKGTKLDTGFRYPPYSKGKMKIVKKVFER